jgi:pimeloyl-ACP methyl ester carboxylesterase
LRVIAPDNIGFGRSDKPADPTEYTFARHVDWMHGLVRSLDLSGVTLVAQDWGGPIGFSVLAREPARFSRVVATNTILHTCDPALAGQLTWAHHGTDGGRVLLQETLLDYIAYYQRAPDITPSMFLQAVAGPMSADVLAARLNDVGVSHARGFSLNTANFFTTDEEIGFGEAVSGMTGGAHYVIDTSRNGAGPAATSELDWCNPGGRAMGSAPTTATAGEHADAYLWVKRPGESDGSCRSGEPPAGRFVSEYAIELVRNAGG